MFWSLCPSIVGANPPMAGRPSDSYRDKYSADGGPRPNFNQFEIFAEKFRKDHHYMVVPSGEPTPAPYDRTF